MKIGTSYHSNETVDIRKFAEDKPIVFVVGAMAHGKVSLLLLPGFFLAHLAFQVEVGYTEQEVAISGYPLSAALTCAKVCTAFEEVWSVR